MRTGTRPSAVTAAQLKALTDAGFIIQRRDLANNVDRELEYARAEVTALKKEAAVAEARISELRRSVKWALQLALEAMK